MDRGADDVASGNPTVCSTGSGWQMSVTVYEDDHEKEISQSDGVRKVIINEVPTLVNTVISSKVRREGFGSEKGVVIIVVPWNRDSIQNVITGALQADTAQVLVPADSDSITVIAIDDHKAGKIQGSRFV